MRLRTAATAVIVSILVIFVVPSVLGSPTTAPAGPIGTIAPAITGTATTNPRYLPLVQREPPTPTPRPTATPTATSTPTTTPAATSTPALPPPSFVDCGTPPSTTNTVNWPIQIVTIDKAREEVTLFNRSPDAVDLTGWQMCSITGGQHHPISGILGAFTVQTYTNTGGPIWNNSNPDPGALYNPAGQLVSYLNS